jgi:uncharacterized membrane protein
VPISPTLGSTLTLVAAAVLAFDGLALAGLGYTSGRLVFIPVGLVLVVSAGLLLIYRRWYRRRLDDILAARRALSEEAWEMQRLLGKK